MMHARVTTTQNLIELIFIIGIMVLSVIVSDLSFLCYFSCEYLIYYDIKSACNTLHTQHYGKSS